jgi:hypothetical protein
MKDINNINKLNCNYKMVECYTFVNYYNTENNIIRISQNSSENKSKLYGNLYYLDISLEELVSKLNTFDNIQFKKRDKYYIETTNVYVDNTIENNVYIII